MTRERISQTIAAITLVLGVVGAADPALIPEAVARWALLSVAIVQVIAGAYGFNVGRGIAPSDQPDPADLRGYRP